MGRKRLLVMGLALALLALGVYATAEKTLPGTPEPTGDFVGDPPADWGQMLSFGDELGYFNVETQVGEYQSVGVGWDGTYIWVTSGGQGANQLYRFGLDGVYQTNFLQGTAGTWGWRDMCFEDNSSNPGAIKGYLHASPGYYDIDEIDPNTGFWTGVQIPSPTYTARAEAWEPPDGAGPRGYIWCGDFYGPLYKVNVSTGAVVTSGATSPYIIYGAAWNDCPGADREIWLTHQNDNIIREWDPDLRVYTGATITRSWGYASGGLSYGQGVEFFGDPTLGVLLNLWQAPTPTPGDRVYAYELCVAQIYDNDMGLASIDAPGPTVVDDFEPVVTVKNIGINTQSGVDVRVTISDAGGPLYEEVVQTGTLAQWETEQLTFPMFSISACGKYDIEARVELVGDENDKNDVKTSSTIVLDYFNDFEVAGCLIPVHPLWEWGVPTSGPGAAYSGEKVWATNLAGSYNPNTCDELRGSFVAVGDAPVLMYRHWIDIESSWDGYNVYMSVNGGPFLPIEPVGGYTQATCIGGCWNCGDPSWAGGANWALVTFELDALVAGDEFEIMWILGTDSSVQYAGVYLDDLGGNCMMLAPPKVDVDVDDDYANLVANTMTLYGTKGGMCFGSFVVVNTDEDLNPDYWDGPGKADFTNFVCEATDLATFHKPDNPIPAANISFDVPAGLKEGEAALGVLSVAMPSHIQYGENDHESKVYRGTVKVTGESDTPCGYNTDFDEFILKVKGCHSTGGKGNPTNSIISDPGPNGITFSWGEFDFADGINVYRSDGADFVKLSDSPLSENSTYLDGNVVAGAEYEYKFGLILHDGREVISGPMVASYARRPAHVSLMPSVPNPMSRETLIRYTLSNDADVSIAVYDASGALVKTLVSETMKAGYHTVSWDGMNEVGNAVANGVYFYRLSSGDFNQSRKIVVLR
jgi:hypothetical protein